VELNRRTFKKEFIQKLETLPLDEFLQDIKQYPEQSLIHPLFSCLYSSNDKVRYGAVASFGQVMARLADKDMEKARVVMRRFMWMLNDESGGIGWGVPEAFAECLTCHAGLAKEYSHVLVSFMREDGFYLELEPLQRGLMWGIGRLAESRPEMLTKNNAGHHLVQYLDSPDATVQKLAKRAVNLLNNSS
jgi:hypothetical protein